MGAFAAIDAPMFVIGAMPVLARSIPGTWTMIGEPGLKPSLRFHAVGSMGVPWMFLPMSETGKSTRRPVEVVGSCTVRKSSGNGRRHDVAVTGSVTIGSQPCTAAVSFSQVSLDGQGTTWTLSGLCAAAPAEPLPGASTATSAMTLTLQIVSINRLEPRPDPRPAPRREPTCFDETPMSTTPSTRTTT